jgi:DNA modification methylase
LDKEAVHNILKNLLEASDLLAVKKELSRLKDDSIKSKISLDYSFFTQDLGQILETQTLERAKYYIRRLISALNDSKTTSYSDLNLKRWKEYGDILTDSLWIIPKRDSSGEHKADYWGNFIPQIPNQLIRRYTKKGDWVLDPFLGSGTTLIECRRLGRNGIGIELQKNVAELALERIEKEKNKGKSTTKVLIGNSQEIALAEELKKQNRENIQFILLHPPYWDIIHFSSDSNDLSNARSQEKFLEMLGKVVDNTVSVLQKGRFMALVIGDKYAGGGWVPLGFFAMQEVLKRDFILKSIVVKNFEGTKGKMNQKELWRYRALAGGFYVFKHEYIFLFQKR